MPIYMVTKGVVQGLIRGGVTQGENDGAWEVDSVSFAAGREIIAFNDFATVKFSTVTVTFPWAPNLPRLFNAFKNEEKFKPLLFKFYDAQGNLESHMTLDQSYIVAVDQTITSDSLPRYTMEIGFLLFKWSTDSTLPVFFTFDVLSGKAS